MNALLVTLLLGTSFTEKQDMTGRVLSRGGKPLAGAHVMIDSAAVRQGTSPLCPSCYADCRKSADTDADGRFRIASVDPELLFNVLVVADGFRPTIVKKTDPAKGPFDVSLSPLEAEKLDPKCVLRGVVFDASDKPLAGARVSAQTFKTDAYSGFSPEIFDPVAVTNLRGEFVLTSKSPITFADLKIEGNGVAPRIVAARKPESNPHTIKMIAGVTLTGRLIRDGKPVAGAAAGLVQTNRGADTFLGELSIGTDEHGRFTFLNVHPNEDYFVYGMMGTIPDGGAVAVVRVHSGGDGATTDAGDLPVVRGHRVKGRVLLSDGKPIPGKTRLLLGREDAWDTQRVELDEEGRFELSGLPTEKYSLSVSLRGYRISSKNHSIDGQNTFRLVGTIDQDIDSLKILMEPGER
jgi:uncharacterized GH25 family protein